MTEHEHRPTQHVKEFLFDSDVVDEERLLESKPGVVHEDIDRPGGIGKPVRDPLDLLPVGEIGRELKQIDEELADDEEKWLALSERIEAEGA